MLHCFISFLEDDFKPTFLIAAHRKKKWQIHKSRPGHAAQYTEECDATCGVLIFWSEGMIE